jgi:glycosyltransferase involved in cell wall biosynthesis
MTQPYLEIIRPALEQVGRALSHVRLRLVAHEPMRFGALAVDFRRWSDSEQEQALRTCHIGLCPMPDTVWTRGKCPYKVLQYMAYGMAWVGSAVGENVAMSSGQQQGLCADNQADWFGALNRLACKQDEREALARRGRACVEQRHSRQALAQQIAAPMARVAEPAR